MGHAAYNIPLSRVVSWLMLKRNHIETQQGNLPKSVKYRDATRDIKHQYPTFPKKKKKQNHIETQQGNLPKAETPQGLMPYRSWPPLASRCIRVVVDESELGSVSSCTMQHTR